MDAIVSLCKRRGFVFQSSEIYGGLRGLWDYGPLGVELKRNIKEAWWRDMITTHDELAQPEGTPSTFQMVGIESSIIMHPRVWKTSGHYDLFADQMVDCRTCKSRFRADHVSTSECPQKPSKCPGDHEACDLTEPRDFNLMFETYVGALRDEENKAFLRPETAQGMFVNFKNVMDSNRVKIPFGIAQQGKSFRNEITPRNFTFRTREFEQMEMEFFCHPEESPKWYAYWRDRRFKWYTDLGIDPAKLILRDHDADELSHYSVGTADVEYAFPFCEEGEFGELEGIAHRGDFDLRSHMEGKLVREGDELVVEKGEDGNPKYPGSGKDMTILNEETKERYVPHVIEPAAGADRTVLAFICNAYHEETITNEKGKEETRVVMKFHPRIAPYKVGVFPLLKNKPELVAKAREVCNLLRPHMAVFYDEGGAIGRRYRRQDEAGTPYGVTIDFDTLGENGDEAKDTITLRGRDTMEQTRMPISELLPFLLEKIR
ncbi:MAG: glycine--tRNA ligase [Verrucomicrobia subdivision 3 bacterium]|nr:glycine--tRNA ligase [Limisphaerales bacterium]